MSLSDALDDALQGLRKGKARVYSGDREAEIDVRDAGHLGVKIARVRVARGAPIDLQEAAAALPAKVHALHEPIVPVEVDGRIGHAVLRTRPDAMRKREFFEVDLSAAGDVDVRRYKVDETGDRGAIDWTLTREQLGRLLDELG